VGVLGIIALVSFGSMPDAHAQAIPIKRAEVGVGLDICPVVPLADPSRRLTTSATDSLLAEGSRAAILGDHESARDLLLEAASLDPLNPVVSYRLARTLDESGEAAPALVEYCRYLALAPTAGDVEEIRERVRQLVDGGVVVEEDSWAVAMREGMEAYDAGRYTEAAAHFARAVEIRPEAPAGLYNRGAAHLAAGNPTQATQDFERYLEVVPDAVDRVEVETRLVALRTGALEPPAAVRRMAEPGTALLQGLVVPGLGQYATGRTGWGAAVFGGVGAAAYLATRTERVTRIRVDIDPFGNPYEHEVEVLERPHRFLGFTAAAAIAIAGAVESYLFATREWGSNEASFGAGPTVGRDSIRSGLTIAPSGTGVRLGFRLATGEPR
jgi:tetratricopeptide (TPR) repeat protein